ncbi:MAG: hypothetical protein CMK83_13710 [Pseudomonadales bacterium]|nr:hypothetical protein [Pseudomonadales bacterium]MAQ25259.1 hypothetical protein [Pseudomonadales bacterium]MBI27883.1 hypothetical protein [Pseudomonadales bacterium]HAU15490.1 hypothetical protein [Gammaproteobacteria bacterium]|tara:strand:+ start:1242 stop:2006 length:765 start_codon:yes stop_codon:yes gene_type:complete
MIHPTSVELSWFTLSARVDIQTFEDVAARLNALTILHNPNHLVRKGSNLFVLEKPGNISGASIEIRLKKQWAKHYVHVTFKKVSTSTNAFISRIIKVLARVYGAEGLVLLWKQFRLSAISLSYSFHKAPKPEQIRVHIENKPTPLPESNMIKVEVSNADISVIFQPPETNAMSRMTLTINLQTKALTKKSTEQQISNYLSVLNLIKIYAMELFAKVETDNSQEPIHFLGISKKRIFLVEKQLSKLSKRILAVKE